MPSSLTPLQCQLCAGIAVLLMSLGIAGCDEDEFVGAPAELMNYTDEDVYLTVRSPNRPDVSTYLEMGKRAGGGKTVCCVGLPKKWRPGLSVQVDYTYGNAPNEKKHRKTVELPPYSDGIAGPIYISVLSEGEVEVVSSMYGPRHPRWSGKMKELPLGGALGAIVTRVT